MHRDVYAKSAADDLAVAAPVKARVTRVALKKSPTALQPWLQGGRGGETVHRDVYTTSAADNLPPFYEVVWVMRVK